MVVLALAGLVAYAFVLVTVLVVRGTARRVIAAAGSGDPGADGPTGAGFADRLIAAEDLAPVEVVVADVDAYRAVGRRLQLAERHAAAVSPAAWAIAAHEVAHAGQHRSGDRTWARWWVVSGHSVWASLAVPVLLVIALITGWVLALLLALACAGILVASGLLSRATERTAVAEAQRLLEAHLPRPEPASTDRVLRAAARLYITESVIDTGIIDRWLEPARNDDPPWGAMDVHPRCGRAATRPRLLLRHFDA